MEKLQKEQNSVQNETNSSTNSPTDLVEIFIGGLPNGTKDEELLALLTKHTEIEELNVKRRNNKKTKKCLGYGIAVVKPENSEKLINLRYLNYNNRRISLTKNLKGEELKEFQKKFTKRRLFIKDLPTYTDDLFLVKTFSKFGELDSYYIRGQPGSELKLGVIIFKEKKSALAAFHFSMNKMIQEISHLNVKVEFDYNEIRDNKKPKKESEKKQKVTFFNQNFPKRNENLGEKERKNLPIQKINLDQHHWIKPGKKNFDYEDYLNFHIEENLKVNNESEDLNSTEWAEEWLLRNIEHLGEEVHSYNCYNQQRTSDYSNNRYAY